MKALITKDIMSTVKAAGWDVAVEVVKTPDDKGRRHQTGRVAASRNGVELRVSNETFLRTIAEPEIIRNRLVKLSMLPDLEWTESDKKFWDSNS